MPLKQLDIEIVKSSIPQNIASFLKDADQRCDEFFNTGANKKTPRFLPADYELIFAALQRLQNNGILEGNFFCEWGSGLGTASCLASLMGFDSIGLEIQAPLIAKSKELARAHSLPTAFIESSFLPPGYEFLPAHGAHELGRPSRKPSIQTYPDADWTIEEIDIFYVYPWPEEQEATLELFENLAGTGAILLAYFGERDVCVYRQE